MGFSTDFGTLGSSSVTLSGGAGTNTLASSSPGNATLHATLDGADVTVPVAFRYETSTALSVTPGTSLYGSDVTFTATVSSPSGTPGGTVTFKEGTTVLGTGTLNGSGVATLVTAALGVGGHTITAIYGGSSSFLGSTSGGVNQLVTLPVAGTTFSATEGVAASGVTVATFTGPAGDSYAASIAWGDGHTSPGTISGSGGSYIVTGTNTYAEEGTYAVGVTVTDVTTGAANPVPASSTAFVGDASLSASGSPGTLSATRGVLFSGVVRAFADADPNGAVGDYAAFIAWGDGSSSPLAAITATGMGGAGPFDVSGAHVYQTAGSFMIQVQVTDDGGSAVLLSRAVTVAAAPLTYAAASPTFVEGASSTVTLATFTDPDSNTDPSLYTASINWQDGHTSAGTVTADGLGGFVVTGTHTYAEEAGSQPFSVTLADTDGDSVLIQGTATVSDAPLTATAVSVSPARGQSFTGVVATFTDADPNGVVGRLHGYHRLGRRHAGVRDGGDDWCGRGWLRGHGGAHLRRDRHLRGHRHGRRPGGRGGHRHGHGQRLDSGAIADRHRPDGHRGAELQRPRRRLYAACVGELHGHHRLGGRHAVGRHAHR